MRAVYICIVSLGILVFGSGAVLSHGVLAMIDTEKAVAVTTEYDDGEPVSYAAVKIFFSGEKIPFQTGRTDRNGRFLFLPDREGEWKAVVNDGMGHQAVVKTDAGYTLDGQEHSTGNGEKSRQFSAVQSVITGLSIIFGLFGLVAFYRGRTK